MALEPVHVASSVHGCVLARQTSLALLNTLAGHAADEPVHFSATSHTPAAGRHSTEAALNLSVGHAPWLHFSS